MRWREGGREGEREFPTFEEGGFPRPWSEAKPSRENEVQCFITHCKDESKKLMLALKAQLIFFRPGTF